MALRSGLGRRRFAVRVATVASSAALVVVGAVPLGAAHATTTAKPKTGTLVVKVLKGSKRLSGVRVCPYAVNSTTKRVGHCRTTHEHGIATLRHVQAGYINLVAYNKRGKIMDSVDGLRIRAGKIKHYTVQTKSTCIACS